MKNFFTSFKKSASLLAAFTMSAMTFNASAETLSGKTATEIASMMTTGWNLGNTFDATGSNTLASETSWGQPYTTQEMITEIHRAGFNTLRLPVSWGKHATRFRNGEGYVINEEWMARVKEVVDYCYNEDMFVILNIHHDNNTGNIVYTLKDDGHSENFIQLVWRQIAEAFKDYDQHLIFEIMNEPRLVGSSNEWWFDPENPGTTVLPALEILNKFNQIGVDEIRGNGSEQNKDRVIMCPGYAACWEGCMTNYFQLPTDETADRLAVSLHAYRPFDLCLGGKDTWLTSYSKEIKDYFTPVYEKYVKNNIPVIIGEESCSARFDADGYYNQEDRLKWAEEYYSVTRDFGMPCVLWDNNVFKKNAGEAHGHFDRNNLSWYDPEFIQKIMDVLGIDAEVDNSVDNISVDNSLAVGPNPATDKIVVSCDNELNSIEIYSTTGTKVMSKAISGSNAEIGVSMLNRGIYTAVVKTETGLNAIKLILK